MTAPALASNAVFSHDSAVSPTPSRRRFTAAYKMKILEETDRRNHHGDIGALLRREGLYSSQLAAWRRAREQGDLAAHAALVQRRGPKPKQSDPSKKRSKKRIAELERELARAVKRAEQAEALVAVQKKVAALLSQMDQAMDQAMDQLGANNQLSDDEPTGLR
jgi:transposase-like protein